MQYLTIVRHGKYSRVEGIYRLNDEGKQQMQDLGASIKQILNGGSAHIISSTAPRALDSAEVLATQLGLENIQEEDYIWSGGGSPPDTYYWSSDAENVMKIVDNESSKTDSIILVTHLEVTEGFPQYFLEEILKAEGRIHGLSTGKAVNFDIDAKTFQYLP